MPTADFTLICPLGHQFTVRRPLIEHRVAAPRRDDEYCPTCQMPGRLVRATRGE